jgi:hypothetical protein
MKMVHEGMTNDESSKMADNECGRNYENGNEEMIKMIKVGGEMMLMTYF